MTTDGDMRRALTRLAKTGSGALDDESFWKLAEIVCGDARLGKVEIPPQDRFIEWCKEAHGIDAQRWTADGGTEAIDFLLPRVSREGRLLIRVLDQDLAALYTGMFESMEEVRHHRTAHLQQPGVWHAPGQVPPITAQGGAPGTIESSEAIPDAQGVPSPLAGSQEPVFPEGYAVPHTQSPVQRRRLRDGAWAHAVIMGNAPLWDSVSTVAEAVLDGITALQSTDHVGDDDAQVEVDRWLDDLLTWWRVHEAHQASNP